MRLAEDFKAFLWRHPEIHGRTRTEMLMDDIRQEMTRIGKQFINDGQPHGRHSPDTITCLRLTMQAALQELVNQRRIENFDIHDATTPTHAFPVMEVVIAPTCSVERIVVDVAINP